MQKIHLLFLIVIVYLPAVYGQHSSVFPQPRKMSYLETSYELNGRMRYYGQEAENEAVALVEKQFLANSKIRFERVENGKDTDIRFFSYPELKHEGYKLVIDASGISLTYGSQAGLIYGLQTLDQYLPADQAGKISVSGVIIEDEPAYSYRGVHLDCARHFFTIDEVKSFLDEMTKLKFNRFHWHLTDDQGWRIEIKQYPKLTETGAWRDSTLIGHYSNTPQVYEKKRYGGFYTQAEASEIVRYAAARGIEVIPEIEMPGHARAALAAYPELSCTGKQLPVEGLWGVFDDIFCSREETRTFLKNVLDEVMTVFPSNIIHIGGDEAPKVNWEACPHCADVKKAHGLKDSHELQSFFIQDIENHVRSKGKTIMGWDEILEGGLAENAVVMSWRGEEGGIAAAKMKHNVVMTPTAFCYFDYYQSGDPGEPLAIGGFLPLKKVYAFNPVPQELNAEESTYIIGGQANLWSEYLPTMKAVQYNAFPRLVALSEILWTGKTSSYSDFASALLKSYLPRLEKAGINFSTSFLNPTLVPTAVGAGLTYEIVYPVEQENKANPILLLRNEGDPMEVKIPIVLGNKGKEGRSVQRDYTFIIHSLIGIPVIFSTPPNPKYNNHGNLALTDGVRGARPWKGDQWLGFSNDTVQFTIDLGEYQTLRNMQLGTLNDPGSWIYSPVKVVVEGSRDGELFKILTNSIVNSEMISLEFKAKARFLKITLINNEVIPAGNPGAGTTPWTFIDELILTR